MNVLLYLAEAFIVAYMMRLAALRLKVPTVSAYVVGGVILGGSLFFWHPYGKTFTEQWLFTRDFLSEMEVITQIALGIIALSIGAELEWKGLRNLGKSVIYITLLGALIPFFLVTTVIWLIWKDFLLALILGAVASATAPAATVAVIQQYKAKGPLTSTIIAVVGLDDAVAFIIFAFTMTISKGIIRHEAIDVINGLLLPISELVISLVIGGAAGLFAARLLVTTKDQESTVFILGTVILLVTGLASTFNVSELLANMATGAVIVNVNPYLKKKIRFSFSTFTPIFYALFFILGGAHLDISGISHIWKIGIAFFLCRAAGKITGASLGAYIGHALPKIMKWIGISLLPQVGAAVALALVVEHEFGNGDYGSMGIDLARNTFNILLVTTFFTEFVGPYLTKLSLVKAGEVREER
ncbi:MAG TPA: cation:proton antiporter [Anaerolineae bacterium]|nr:cation:proton antiporter [Anaerolineae bacterium]